LQITHEMSSKANGVRSERVDEGVVERVVEPVDERVVEPVDERVVEPVADLRERVADPVTVEPEVSLKEPMADLRDPLASLNESAPEHPQESSLNSIALNNLSNPRSPPGSDDSDTDDEYILSDDEVLRELASREYQHHQGGYSTSLSDYATYFSNTLSHALDSLALDKSLVLQAQMSGKLNNENQKLIDKRQEVVEQLKSLKQLYNDNFELKYDPILKTKIRKVELMNNDLKDIQRRIERLKNGKTKSGFLFLSSDSTVGVVKKFPIEYNQARDKVLERQIDEY